MIKKIKHRGLKKLYETGKSRGLPPAHVEILEEILSLLDTADKPGNLALPGYGLHPLKGDRKGEWAVKVSGNWRVTFRFDGTDATDVNYEDYH